jgi:hypothetical protein
MQSLSYITGSVHKDLHELISLLCAETERRGYKIRRDWSWGYASRPIAGTKTPSNHSWGLAVDLNAPTNPQRRPLTTNMPPWMTALWRSYGFRWGGDYTSSTPDPMHYEFMGTPAQAREQTARARAALGVRDEEDVIVEAVVKGIQEELIAAGFRDHEGKVLVADGKWGRRTQAAFRNMTRTAMRADGIRTGSVLTRTAGDERYLRRGAEVTLILP